MQRLYLVPSEAIQPPESDTTYFGPKYFAWRSPAVSGSGSLPKLGQRDYSFVNCYIVLADLSQADHDALILNADVFAFPVDLDQSIAAADIAPLRTIFEGFNVPTDWLTPANTYRELVRQMYGIVKFAGKFAVIAAELGYPSQTFLFNSVDLDTRYRDFPVGTQEIFEATVAWYGIDPGLIKPNSTMRQMLKLASDAIQEPMPLGGYTF